MTAVLHRKTHKLKKGIWSALHLITPYGVFNINSFDGNNYIEIDGKTQLFIRHVLLSFIA